MQKPRSVAELTELGRVRLSKHFFMREMLYSEVANFHGLPNIPDDPDLAIEAGRNLCARLLDPLHERFGGLVVRSAYRSPTVNDFCHQRRQQDPAYFCGSNAYNRARHIWDMRDEEGYMGATATVVVPAYLSRFERTQDPEPLAWWIRDNLAEYAEVTFFRWLCAFNIRWYEGASDQAIYIDREPDDLLLTRRGAANFDGEHSDRYRGLVD